MSGEVHILILSCGDTSGEVRMFHGHLRDAASGEVRRVGPRVGRFVEALESLKPA